MRIKEHSMEIVGEVFTKVQDSNFLNGDNDNNWKASFDWIFKANNFIKILEDNYINKTKHGEKSQRDIEKRAGVSKEYYDNLWNTKPNS